MGLELRAAEQAGISTGIQASSLYFTFLMKMAKIPNQLNKLPEAISDIYKIQRHQVAELSTWFWKCQS